MSDQVQTSIVRDQPGNPVAAPCAIEGCRYASFEAQIVALTQERDQAQRQASLLLEQSSQRGDEIKILTAQVQALEAAASHQPNLRDTLGRYLDGATMLRQRPSRLILQDLFALIHEYDKAHPESEHVKGEAAASWQPIATAPQTGQVILAFGIHDHSPPDAQKGVKAGDYWWAIILWDIWREPQRWVFLKDGKPTWSAPTHWMPLPAPPAASRREEEP